MANLTSIAILRTDGDAELVTSVRQALEADSKDLLGSVRIEEYIWTGPGCLLPAWRGSRPNLVIVIEGEEGSVFADFISARNARSFARSPFLLIIPERLAAEAPRLLKAGAADFVLPPVRPWDLLPRVLHLVGPREPEEELVAHLKAFGQKQMVGQSPIFLELLRKLRLLAGCDATVLITGETGTGKELCARAVHYFSRRTGMPFVTVDCGAIPSELIENELFGHAEGAYTSAPKAQLGILHESEGGTLFLDEIDALSVLMQSKLLRFLQEREYRPVGSPKTRQADVRIVTASNISLEDAVRAGRFRRDLFYRLNVLSLVMPPLRERREDIPILARHFLEKYAVEFGRPVRDFTADALKRLMEYSWPGNARELENTVERAILASAGPVIDGRDLELPARDRDEAWLSYQARKDRVVRDWERDELKRMLTTYRGNITAMARVEGKDPSAFRALLRKHQLCAERVSPYWEVRQ